MPELPEVETVRRALEAEVSGRLVTAVRGRPVRLRRPLDPDAVRAGLVGRRLAGFRRRGKFLLLDTTDGGGLLVHLGMSGRLRLWPEGTTAGSHTHLRLSLDDGRELALVDPRRFGLAVFLPPGAEAEEPALVALGPDALDPDLPEVLDAALERRRAPVKAVLLDQRVVAGLGNIYACEALWRAGVHPARPARSLSRPRRRRLGAAAREVLEEAVARGGTTLRDFAGVDGRAGMFRLELAVYGREGEPCPRCRAPVRRAPLAGRSTWWCPRCQR